MFYVGLLAIGVGAYYFLMPQYRQMTKLTEQRDEMFRKIDYKKNAIEDLKVKQKRFDNDPEFVELIARQHKRIHKNEFLFVVVPD